jgi:hypothetical protein
MALGWTQPLTEISAKNLPGGKGRLAREAHNLTVICEPIVQQMWELQRLTNLWASKACYRIALTLTYSHRVLQDKGPITCQMSFCHNTVSYSLNEVSGQCM